MRCPNCREEVSERWKFCPKCGSRLERERDIFSDIFERMDHELKEMDKVFERNLEVFDLSPFFRKPTKSSGFSIKISRSGDEKPKVSVKTFGDVDREEVESEMEKLGFRETPKLERAVVKEKGISLESAKMTEEPETCVRRVGDKIVVEVKLPGVMDTKDIEVKTLENSIEVKAMAGDKAYFKILTKPGKANVVRKYFENGILRVELV
jgi:HSP20 family molecular chaperone IbpA